jgi:NADH-quinone oxidoreductase subunit L
MYAFWLLVIGACLTSFYSWRLMFMTFWGEPRWAAAGLGVGGHGHDGHGHGHGHGHDGHAHDGHGSHEPHESPMTMLIPLAALALGAVFSGMVWYKVFFGDEAAVRAWFGMEAAAHGEATEHGGEQAAAGAEHAAEGGEHAAATPTEGGTVAQEAGAGADDAALPARQGAIYMHPDNHVLHDAHYVPTWVRLAPFVAMLIGLATAWLFYIRRTDLPARLAQSQRPLYLFLLNKWYFDEVYDFLFVRPAKALGSALWRRGDGAVIDGTINGIAMGAVPFLTRLAGRAQSGYIFTYAFAMVIGIALLVTWVMLTGGAE